MHRSLWLSAVGTALLTMGFSIEARDSSAPIEEVVIVAHPLSGEGLSQPSDILIGKELERKVSTSIGETLAQEPGVHSGSFGKAVGRPVIHGLGGPRVRIMEDRIDALDLSVTSADHAVTVEPFIAERIEVLKGSSALLYGSGAIGGVVDVHTNRIPHQLPDRSVVGGLEARFDDNTNGNSIAAKLNGGFGSFAWHADGTWKDGDDYKIPGFAESARLRALEGGGDGEAVRGSLPGSAFDSKGYAGGAAYVSDWGFIGAALSRLEADYGLPGGHAEEGTQEATPTLELEQTRTDFELGIEDPFGLFSSLNIRLGINDYQHQEIEPDGEVGTTFANDAWELRTELVYETGQWTGALGVQHTSRKFSAVGEEAFVPPVDTYDTGVFWIGQRAFDNFDLEAGARLGRVEHQPDAGPSRNFATGAVSLGVVVPIDTAWQFGLIADYSVRAPVGEELYSNGPHLTTRAFEVGDPSLDTERAINVAATLRLDRDTWKAAATAYFTRFSGFIYQLRTGAQVEELPVLRFGQDSATFVGIDLEMRGTIAQWDAGSLEVKALLDYVDAELDVVGNDNLPRIPPLRYGVGLETTFGIVTASIDYTRYSEQADVADRELTTDGYDDLRAYLGVEVISGVQTLELFLEARNLTDDEQRHHTSFIKEFAPAPGRTVEAGLRLLF